VIGATTLLQHDLIGEMQMRMCKFAVDGLFRERMARNQELRVLHPLRGVVSPSEPQSQGRFPCRLSRWLRVRRSKYANRVKDGFGVPVDAKRMLLFVSSGKVLQAHVYGTVF
jgi:hypothetical protein